jgi:hypothetical protein
MMVTSSKCRPRNSAGRFWVTVSPYQIASRAIATDPKPDEIVRAAINGFPCNFLFRLLSASLRQASITDGCLEANFGVLS